MADNSPNPIPFSEPPYLRGLPSPYHTPAHFQFQKRCRQFLWKHLISHAMEWERAGIVPLDVFGTFCKHNLLVALLPPPLPMRWLKDLNIHDILGVDIQDWDYMYTAIFVDETSRSGLGGPPGALNAGFCYGIPPILRYGCEELQERLLPSLLTGKARTCLAITEPDAGSDVANITTTAKKTKDGKFYIVNGAKKWITNGIWSDYSTMTVRTGGPGAGGLSVLVVPLKGHSGVKMWRMDVSGQKASGITYIELENVQVPVENLVGNEGDGMHILMTNFNHERLALAIGIVRKARVTLSAAFDYTTKRMAFGKPLIDQPVVRHRLAKAGGDLETISALVDQLLYQLTHLSKDEGDRLLGGTIALAKARAAHVLNECAQCAVVLFGGKGFTASGQGALVEAIYRDAPGVRIPGGSEDVLLDLAVRQMLRTHRVETKRLRQQSKI